MRLHRVDGTLTRADGSPIRSEVSVEKQPDGEGIDLILHSRGGTKDSSQETNPDYFEALEEVLRRLGKADAVIRAIFVDSTRVARLPESERVLDLDFPMRPSKHLDLDRLRKDITQAQQSIGQLPGAKGGNSTKRIRIRIDPSSSIVDATSVVVLLSQRPTAASSTSPSLGQPPS